MKFISKKMQTTDYYVFIYFSNILLIDEGEYVEIYSSLIN